jgi:UDP-N-acetylmuramyl tripeptide synthase
VSSLSEQLVQGSGEFTFANAAMRASLAGMVRQREIDVLIVGPLTRVGMDAAGTLQEVAAFMRLLAEVRRECGRR